MSEYSCACSDIAWGQGLALNLAHSIVNGDRHAVLEPGLVGVIGSEVDVLHHGVLPMAQGQPVGVDAAILEMAPTTQFAVRSCV